MSPIFLMIAESLQVGDGELRYCIAKIGPPQEILAPLLGGNSGYATQQQVLLLV